MIANDRSTEVSERKIGSAVLEPGPRTLASRSLAADSFDLLRGHRSRLGLHRRIALMVAVGLLVSLGTFGALGVRAVNEATNRDLQERLLIVQMAAGQLDRSLMAMTQAMDVAGASIRLDPSGREAAQNQAALHQLLVEIEPRPQRILLVDVAGTIVATDHADPSLVGQKAEARIAEFLSVETTSISSLIAPTSGRNLVSVTAPLRDERGTLIGAVSADFDLTHPNLFGFLQPVKLGLTGAVQLIDSQGSLVSVITSAERERSAVVDRARYAALVEKRAPYVGVCHDCHAGPAGAVRSQDIVAFAPLTTVPWGIILRQSADEAFATANDLRNQMIAFGLFLLIGGLTLAKITTQSVVKPIEGLTNAAKRIAAGDLASPVPAVGHSEIAVLAATLDVMRGQVYRCLEEIEGWNESLENRVLQRTRELTALLQMAKSLTSTLDVATLLDLTVKRAADTFKSATAGAILLHDRSHDQLVVRASVGYDCGPQRRAPVALNESIPGRVFLSGRGVRTVEPRDIEAAMTALGAPRHEPIESGTLPPAGHRSCICAPLVTHDRPIGCLLLVSPDTEAFTDSDLGLLRAIADQAAVAVENAQLYEEVRRSEAARGELVAKLIGAQEEERHRIARELHDETSQALTALVMSLARLRKATPPTLQAVQDGISEIESLAGMTLDEIHRLVHDLRPTLLDDLGLVPAIQWYLETYAQKSGLRLDLQLERMEERLPPQVETVLFRVVQEAITNVVRHAHARAARVRLSRGLDAVTATIEDDGRGFDTRAFTKRNGQPGLGILGMKERIYLLGGRFAVVSRPNRGTKLTVEVPLEAKDS